MADNAMRVGAVVRLKSGGPKMTLQAKQDEGWHCVWFDAKGDKQSDVFPEDTLETYSPPGPQQPIFVR